MPGVTQRNEGRVLNYRLQFDRQIPNLDLQLQLLLLELGSPVSGLFGRILEFGYARRHLASETGNQKSCVTIRKIR